MTNYGQSIKNALKTMKKIFLSLFIGFLATSCNTIYKIVPTPHNYTESISYTIDRVEEGKAVSTGNGSWHASRGNKFVFVFINFKNNLDQKQELDFDNFVLLNPRTKTKHKAEWAMVSGPFNIWGKIDSYIRKGDEKTRKLVYIFPEEDKAQMLMVNDEMIEIEYTK